MGLRRPYRGDVDICGKVCDSKHAASEDKLLIAYTTQVVSFIVLTRTLN